MKQPYEIKEQIKQAKFYHWKKFLKKNLKKTPDNCIYNRLITLPKTGHKIKVCGYNDCFDNCYRDVHAQKCNVFVFKKNREKLEEDFEGFFKDPLYVKQNFKDITALAWTLDSDIKGNKKPNIFKRMWRKIISIFK